jgi:asparagine synthase (glutamine-hydrolysing)
MSHVARQTVKVVLSGEGADEVFGGYPKYAFANSSSLLSTPARFLGPRTIATLVGVLGMSSSRALVAARSMAQVSELERIVQWFSYVERQQLEALFPKLGWTDDDWNETTAFQRAALSRIHNGSPLHRMQMVDCLTWLPGNMLERGDRMTMAEGLEMRTPFLDKELVAFGLGLADRFKVRRGVGKWIVRRWAAELPPAIVRRKKWGFRVPLAAWFRGPLRPMLYDYLCSSRGISAAHADQRRVRKLLSDHDSGSVDLSAMLWTLLSAEVWYQEVYLRRTAESAESSS